MVYLYALALAKDGNFKSSERAWNRLLALEGLDAYALRHLAFLYSASDETWWRPEDARKHAEAACDLTSPSPGIGGNNFLAL